MKKETICDEGNPVYVKLEDKTAEGLIIVSCSGQKGCESDGGICNGKIYSVRIHKGAERLQYSDRSFVA